METALLMLVFVLVRCLKAIGLARSPVGLGFLWLFLSASFAVVVTRHEALIRPTPKGGGKVAEDGNASMQPQHTG